MRPVRRDPAPSRAAYRMHRLWLTPSVRAVLRVGVPFLCVFAVVSWYLSDQGRRDEIGHFVTELRRSIAERPEFAVTELSITGASEELEADIRDVLIIDFPISSFGVDLDGMHKVVADLDAVNSARVQIRAGGVLEVAVTERVPAVIWRGRHGLELLDNEGRRVGTIAARTDRPDLPVIAGDGANEDVAQALVLMDQAAPIGARLRGLVRMGARRWDVVLDGGLDGGQRILLPEQAPGDALLRVIALDQAEDLLSRDISVVDMRNGARPTLRMAPGAVEQLRRIRVIEAGVDEE